MNRCDGCGAGLSGTECEYCGATYHRAVASHMIQLTTGQHLNDATLDWDVVEQRRARCTELLRQIANP